MSDWVGLDAGGTEQLWEENVLVRGLQILKRHEPFQRNDPGSPIFEDLETEIPGPTWNNVNRDGSFRPIFRKCHPWKKLGLTNGNSDAESVTPRGDDLINGFTSIQEIFIEATRNFSENDGSRSFGIMCAAALEDPLEEFSIEDVEFGISNAYDPRVGNLSRVLSNTRSVGSVFGNDNHGRTRKRRVRDLLNSLVTARALKKTTTGWKLDDPSSAIQIAHTMLRVPAPRSPATRPAGRGGGRSFSITAKRKSNCRRTTSGIEHKRISERGLRSRKTGIAFRKGKFNPRRIG
jgi:hypothetical protein